MFLKERLKGQATPALQAGGQGFDSLNLHHMGQ